MRSFLANSSSLSLFFTVESSILIAEISDSMRCKCCVQLFVIRPLTSTIVGGGLNITGRGTLVVDGVVEAVV